MLVQISPILGVLCAGKMKKHPNTSAIDQWHHFVGINVTLKQKFSGLLQKIALLFL